MVLVVRTEKRRKRRRDNRETEKEEEEEVVDEEGEMKMSCEMGKEERLSNKIMIVIKVW